MKLRNKRSIVLVILLFDLLFILIGAGLQVYRPSKKLSIESQVLSYYSNNMGDFTYLSDIEYIAKETYTKYDRIRYDEVNGGTPITLRIENNAFSFKKGIWAHATSQITYDISKYNYKYFTAFIGLNTSSDGGNGVKYYIYTSKDGKNWDEPSVFTKLPKENATFITIDITAANYLRLVADDNGSNGKDHSVYADAKLTNDANQTSAFKTVDEYNEIIKNQYIGQTDVNGELEFNVLKKELIKNVGQFTLNSFYNENVDNKAVIDWLMSDQNALRYYILGGKPEGSYYNSLTELSRLYRNYKEDFNNKEITQYGTVLGDLYLKMAVSLSHTHSKIVGLWMQSSVEENKSDSVRRYAIYKYMHKNGNLNVIAGLDIAKWFENYTIEEMRFVMNNNIDDEEILWLNAYTQQFIDQTGTVGNRLTPHPYIAYVWPNYSNPIYYSDENKEYFNDLFSVPDKNNSGKKIGLWDVTYQIPGGKDVPVYTLKVTRGTSDYKVYKVWMNMRNKFGTGAVCGGISKTGSNIRGVHGIPSAVIGQPGHAAIIYYSQDANGNGYWNLDNDVSGWAYSEKGERMLLGWGNDSYSRGYSVVYMALAQEVINNNTVFEQSEKFVYLANSYSDLVKKEEMYRKALKIQPLNINAWYGLIQTYNSSTNKGEADYFELAKEMGQSLKYFPLPMYHLTNLLKPKLTSIETSYQFTLLQTRILKEASATPNNTDSQYYVYQPSLTRLMANFLLGQMDTTIATFSFDGQDKDTIVLSDRFDGNGVRWDYSLDGKKTWKEVSFSAEEAHKHKLTKEEIASITSENDLYIHIVGVNYADENLYKIDISESVGLPTILFANDLENRFIGATDSIEWKYNENDKWTRYGEQQPQLTGDKTVILRMGATGTYLASPTNSVFIFTKDPVNNKRKYIPVSHLSIEAVSTEATNHQGSATFAIDANYNTRWHSDWNGGDTNRFITVKLDKPVYLSAVEFVPAAGGNGKIYDGTIYGSMDGENWIELSKKKGLTYTSAATTVDQAIANIKEFDIEDPQKVQYVKIVADRTNGNWFTARAFNFYEDTTIKQVATFSFDGANAGEIRLYDEYSKLQWKYSIDGGKTWQKVTNKTYQLSESERNKINDKNMIKIVLDGDKTEYIIKIKKGETPEKGYLNDLENRPIAQPEQENLEWKISGEKNWTSYQEKQPNVKGNKTLLVRRKATGLTTASDTIEYVFTDDNQPKNMTYISNKHLSIHDFLSQSQDSKRPHYAPNVLDGNPNTQWHTDFRVSIADKEAFITIKLDEARYISGLDYLHMDAQMEPYGFMKNGKVYVSEDGENWKEAATISNVAQDNTLKHIAFDNSIYGQYVKLVIESHDNVFAAASMINLYEDRTKVPEVIPTAEVEYSTTQPTNQDVVVKLVNPSTEITITNNDGKDTYTFTQNGTFTFEFENKFGDAGQVTAKVDWIDKKIPNATITYSTTKPTNKDVVATVTFDKEGVIVEGGNTHTFTENGTYEFKFTGPAGNKGVAVAKVDWIDKEPPKATIEYDITYLTNQNVVATIKFNEKNVKITNNNSSNKYIFKDNGEFTFTFVDAAGNSASAKAEVNWIDKRLSTPTINYSTTKPTNKDVVATVTFDKEGVIVEGGNTHTFTENGTYEFNFIGPAGNKGVAVAKVDWIDKKVPVAEISYNPTDKTNKDVVATITFDEKNVKITNNSGKNTHTFTSNGTFKFTFEDAAGNKGSIMAIVNIIDKIAPTAKVKYSTTDPTTKNVVVTLTDYSEDITITNNNGKNTYTFTENGTFTFEFIDKAGNIGTTIATVNNIVKEEPSVEVSYSTTKLTNKNVIATLVSNKKIIITNNGGKNTYTFTENGTFTFEFIDELGNKRTAKAKVNNIDKVIPTAKVTYSTTKPTNKNVVVTLTDYSEEITITNNDGKNTYTFTENGAFTFEFVDKAGNIGSANATVQNIDKIAPTAKVIYSTTEPTNQDVTATITGFSEDVKITNNNGKTTKVFTKNGVFTFEFIDNAGNKGTVTAIVNNIKKVAPTAKVVYSTTKPTNKNVIATLSDLDSDITITNNNGKNTYTFTENGTFTFEFIDNAGNVGSVVAIVNNIDKVSPTAKVIYNPTTFTTGNVVATLDDISEEITVLNNNGKMNYTFHKNGIFEFKISDKAGNIAVIKAEVTWIRSSQQLIPETPTTPVQPNQPITSNNQNKNQTITENIPNAPNTSMNENQIIYKNYTFDEITLNVPSNYFQENTKLKLKYLNLESSIQEKIDGDYKYFELYTEPISNINSDNKITMYIAKEDKKFLGIYKVKDNTIESLEYKKLEDDKIEVQIDSLGKYLLSYENKKENDDSKDGSVDKFKNTSIKIIVLMILLLETSVVLVLKTRKK